MKEFPDVIAWSIPAFLLLVVLERVSYLLHRDDDEVGYGGADTATSLAMGLGSVFTDLLWKVPIAAAYALLYAFTPLRVAEVWWSWPLILLAQDFFYYWSHRGHHVIRILWAAHVVHHSSQRFNLSTALRQPWTSLTGWIFYVPLILAGVHPAVVAFCAVGQPALPVLDPHRTDRPAARVVRGGVQHPVAPPGAPRLAGRLPGPQLRRHPDRLGPAVRLVRTGAGTLRLRPDQERRQLQPRPGGLARVRLDRPGPARRRDLAAPRRAPLPSAGLAADAGCGQGSRPCSTRRANLFSAWVRLSLGAGPEHRPGHPTGRAARQVEPLVPDDLGAVAAQRGAAQHARAAQQLAVVHDADLVRRVDPDHPHLVAQRGRAERGDRLDQAALAAVALDDPHPGERDPVGLPLPGGSAAKTRSAGALTITVAVTSPAPGWAASPKLVGARPGRSRRLRPDHRAVAARSPSAGPPSVCSPVGLRRCRPPRRTGSPAPPAGATAVGSGRRARWPAGGEPAAVDVRRRPRPASASVGRRRRAVAGRRSRPDAAPARLLPGRRSTSASSTRPSRSAVTSASSTPISSYL